MYYYEKNETINTFRHNLCPKETFFNNKSGNIVCISCGIGKTAIRVVHNDELENCTNCLDNYKKVNIINNEFRCDKCDQGDISIRKKDFSFECIQTGCRQTQFYDKTAKMCLECNEILTNSIGRSNNSPPLKSFCTCPNDSIKIKYKNSKIYKCLHLIRDLEEIKIIFKILKNNNKLNGIYNIERDLGKEDFSFRICPTFKRLQSFELDCICNEGFQISLNGCEVCLIPTIDSDDSNGITCNICTKNSIMSHNKQNCICLEGFEPHYDACKPCKKGYFKNTISNEKCMLCPTIYTSKSYGSTECKNIKTAYAVIFGFTALIIVAAIVPLGILVKKKITKKKN